MDQSHYYRQWWYWGGEASIRVHGTKMQLTSIPDEEWAQVEAAARVFWDEVAAESETKAKVVEIFKQYNADMERAGRALPLHLIAAGRLRRRLRGRHTCSGGPDQQLLQPPLAIRRLVGRSFDAAKAARMPCRISGGRISAANEARGCSELRVQLRFPERAEEFDLGDSGSSRP